MPFIAFNKETKKRIDITLYDDPKAAIDIEKCVCQDCGAPLFIRSGDFYQPHFVHMQGYDDRACFYRDSGGESEAHREAKRLIARALRRRYPQSKIEIEYPVDTKDGKKYIDIYLETDEVKQAHEAQLSNQTIQRFRERTQAYKSIDIEAVWWLGGAAKTRENQAWIESNCDFIGEIAITSQKHRIISESY